MFYILIFKLNTMNKLLNILMIALAVSLVACTTTNGNEKSALKEDAKISQATPPEALEGLQKAYFASGCFWCVEAVFESVKGVEEAVSGYAGGHTKNPTYETIGTGQTGHTETVEVYYDPKVVSYETLLKVFFGSQDPTTLNRQGPDKGTQYRSAIFYRNETEKNLAKAYIKELDESGVFGAKIVTEVAAYTKFYKAEDYHQDFERLNPNQGYVRAVSIPRLNRFKKKFPELLKENH